MDFRDKIAVVTGGSEGIGFGIAQALSRNGAKIYLIARNQEKLERAKEKIGRETEVFSANITNFERAKEIIDEIYAKEKKIDIFVNNAGRYVSVNTDTDIEVLREITKLDFEAPRDITHYLIQKAKKHPAHLKLLTVVSQAALQTFPEGLGYGVAKAALASYLMHMDKQMQVEGIKNITSYRIYPGTVATEAVLPLVKSGKLQNPTTLESVVDTAMALLRNQTRTRDSYVGYVPRTGIVRRDYPLDLENWRLFSDPEQVVIDSKFDPSQL